MLKLRSLIILAWSLLAPAFAYAQAPAPVVWIQTSLGDIAVELDQEKAPITVANFLRYVGEKHFDGTVVYRVEPGFVLQLGSYDAAGNRRPSPHDAIALEANNGLRNLRGAISMARNDEPASATTEFFINLADNPALDPLPTDTANRTGYAVFGRVISGIEIVDKIAAVPVGGNGPFPGKGPLTPVTINRIAAASQP